MEIVKAEPSGTTEGRDGQEQRVRFGSAIPTPHNGVEIHLTQPESLSIGSDGNCCVLKSSTFRGKLRFEGSARIECEVAAEVHGTDVITIAEGALATAPIRAASVLIEGGVSADVIASKRIEIRPSARVLGNLAAPAIVVHEGAKVEGHFSMNSGLQASGS